MTATLFDEVNTAASERYTGLLSIDAAKASIYFLFGTPTAATFKRGKTTIEGKEALDAIAEHYRNGAKVTRRRVQGTPPTATLAGLSAGELAELVRPDATATDEAAISLDGLVLPVGRPIMRDVPLSALDLHMLLGNLATGICTVRAEDLLVAILREDGETIETIALQGRRITEGEAAADLIRAALGSTVSMHLLDADVVHRLPGLLRIPVVHDGLRGRWIGFDALLDEVEARGGTAIVEVRTADDHGLVLLEQGGRRVAYTARSPEPGPVAKVASLASAPEARVRVRSTIAPEADGFIPTPVPATIAAVIAPEPEPVEEPTPVADELQGPVPADKPDDFEHADISGITATPVPAEDYPWPDDAVAAITTPDAVTPDDEEVILTLAAQPQAKEEGQARASTPSVVSAALLPQLKDAAAQRFKAHAARFTPVLESAAAEGWDTDRLAQEVRKVSGRAITTRQLDDFVRELRSLVH